MVYIYHVIRDIFNVRAARRCELEEYRSVTGANRSPNDVLVEYKCPPLVFKKSYFAIF